MLKLDRQNIGPACALVALFLLAGIGFVFSQSHPISLSQRAESGQASSINCNNNYTSKNRDCSGGQMATNGAQNPNADNCDSEKPRSQAREECLLTRYTGQLARYTLALFIATLVLGVVGIVGLFVTGYQSFLGRQEYIASHRPRLRMRLLQIEGPILGTPFKIQFDMANIGETKATIVDVELTLQIRAIDRITEDGQFVGYRDRIVTDRISGGPTTAAGESYTIKHTMSLRYEPEWGSGAFHRNTERIVVIGIVRYSDDLRITRRTAFYRFCTEDPNRFRMGDFEKALKRDREYED